MEKYTFKYWKDTMSGFCMKNGGTGNVVKSPSMGWAGNYYNYEMVFTYKDLSLKLGQGVMTGYNKTELSFLYLSLEYEIEVKKSVYLTLNRQDWWSRIFSRNNNNTGNSVFDKIFVVRSSEPKLGAMIFSNKQIADMFIDNVSLVLNISTKKRRIKIMLKDFCKKFHTEQEMSDLLFCMKFIIDRVLFV